MTIRMSVTRTKIIDKNGKATTVYKSSGGVVTTPKREIPKVEPERAAAASGARSLFDVKPLSAEESEQFLLFLELDNDKTESVVRDLAPRTKAMLWEANMRGVLDKADIAALIKETTGELRFGRWDKSERSYEITDNLLQSTTLVIEAIKDDCPLVQTDQSTWAFIMSRAVIGSAHIGEGVPSLPPAFTSVEDVAPVAGLAAFLTGAREYSTEDAANKRFVPAEYEDAEERSFFGIGVANKTLKDYVMAHPETGYQLGKFAAERDLGTSKEDAQTAIDYLIGTSDARAIREGWL